MFKMIFDIVCLLGIEWRVLFVCVFVTNCISDSDPLTVWEIFFGFRGNINLQFIKHWTICVGNWPREKCSTTFFKCVDCGCVSLSERKLSHTPKNILWGFEWFIFVREIKSIRPVYKTGSMRFPFLVFWVISFLSEKLGHHGDTRPTEEKKINTDNVYHGSLSWLNWVFTHQICPNQYH